MYRGVDSAEVRSTMGGGSLDGDDSLIGFGGVFGYGCMR